MAQVLSMENPVFKAYMFYTGVLSVKLLSMAFLTARQRVRKGVFANPEDAKTKPKAIVSFNDSDVERVRRAHLNDLENIPIFLAVAIPYIMTNPEPSTAINVFRLFTFSRILHTIVYAVVVIPQPARALAFFGGLASTLYMAGTVIYQCW